MLRDRYHNNRDTHDFFSLACQRSNAFIPSSLLSHHGPVCCPSTRLDVVAIDTRRMFAGHVAQPGLISTVKVDIFKVEGMDMTGKKSRIFTS